MKTKLRLTMLELRENPDAGPTLDLAAPLTPPQSPPEVTMLAVGDASSAQTLYVGPPTTVSVGPSTEPGPAGDRQRQIDQTITEILAEMRLAEQGDTFVGPPLPPSLVFGPPERPHIVPLFPLIMPGY